MRKSILLRKIIHPLVLLLTKTRVKYIVNCTNELALLPDKPVIFAVNHTNSLDFPVTCRAIKKHCYPLIGKQKLYLSDRVFFFLNGGIWVDRKNKDEMQQVKKRLIEYLIKNKSIVWYPEGTWNLTDNLLILPMRWGIIDVAIKAKAQIAPIVLDYDRDKMVCNIRFGNVIIADEDSNKSEKIRELRDTMATLRWELWEENVVLHRSEISIEKLKKEMFVAIEEYPPIDWEYEKSTVFQPEVSAKEAFAHLEELIPKKENAFLFKR